MDSDGVADADVSLIGLSGKLCGRKYQFLLDSGASCNFVSQEFLVKLGIDWDLVISQPVQLADKTVLKTSGKVDLKIAFGPFTYFGTFYVLQAKVPQILGMQFFRDVQPDVLWKDQKVFVRSNGARLSLPVVKFRGKSVHASVNSWPGEVQRCDTFVHDNSFRELDVDAGGADDIDDNDADGVQLLPDSDLVVAHVDKVGKVEKKVCRSCGCYLANGLKQQCNKCAATSFVHLENQLVDDKVGHVTFHDVENGAEVAADVAKSVEIVPLKQFIAGGKRQHYLHFGVVMLNKRDDDDCKAELALGDVLDVISNDQQVAVESCGGVSNCLKQFNLARNLGLKSKVQICGNCGNSNLCSGVYMKKHIVHHCNKCSRLFNSTDRSGMTVGNPLSDVFNDMLKLKFLNFTHRAAHGGNDDGDVQHGQYEQLAQDELARLQKKFPGVFAEPVYPVDRSKCPQQFFHEIPLVDENADPPKKRLYPLDSVELQELKSQIQELLDSNRIEPSKGAYGAPILFAKKKDGRLRMCIDYRLLNQQTRNDVFPLPRIDELLQRLDGAAVFSKLDLRDGYHQIPMVEGDRHKTAFTCRYGSYQFTVMPFGLMTAPATFQRVMNNVFFELLDEGVLCYLDDLLLYTKDVASHRVLLDKVFSILQKNKLYIKAKKCHLFLTRVNFLGHVVDQNGVSLESTKVKVIRDWPVLENVNQVQQFLGLCNYYRKFVFRFSEIASPLTLLTRKGQVFKWGEEQQKAFDLLKNALCNAPVLKVFDPALDTRVVCDASQFCCGAVLEQCVEGSWRPVEYYSKRLSSAERNYSATDREFVAIRLALEKWRQFLVGKKFTLLTDHAALTYLQTSQHVSRRNARWLDFLSQFQFDIVHIKGKENVVADALSRIPGTDKLDLKLLCSMDYSFGLQHQCDVGKDVGNLQLHSIITIHENETFLAQLQAEQEASSSSWFIDKCQLAQNGSHVWQFRNGVLCKLVGDTFCPVIPDNSSSSVHVVLSELHSSALAGHFGSKKLLKLAQARFYWQNMFGTVEKFCRNCAICQSNKSSTKKPAGLLQPVENPDGPFQHVTMDFIVHLPVSNRGYDSIFTIVDRFSRLVRFIPCHTAISAEDVASLFFEHWVCRHGMPKKIVCDRDVKFQSQFWQELTRLLDCRVAMSTAYHPQTDGLSERFHRSVEQVLRCYCSGQQERWCSLLSQCEFALNSTYQDATATAPFKVIYGFDPSLPLDQTLSGLKVPAVGDLVAARRTVQSQVKSSLAAAQQRMEGLINPKRRAVSFEAGSRAWLSTAHLPVRLGARKLSAKWAGPFTVLQQVSPEAYRLELPPAWRQHPVFHVSQLKEVSGNPQKEAAVQLEDGEKEFEVERVCDMRVGRGNKREFLVKWKGYGEFENSWEPESNLTNCKTLL